MVAAANRPSTEALENELIDQVLDLVEIKQGNRSYRDLASEIGVSRTMLRVLELRGIPPGLDTLARLVDWDEQTFLPVVVNYIKRRGAVLRQTTRETTHAVI